MYCMEWEKSLVKRMQLVMSDRVNTIIQIYVLTENI